MHNVFTSARAQGQGISPIVLTAAVACCIVRLSRGIYMVAAECRRHGEFARFIDDGAVLGLREAHRSLLDANGANDAPNGRRPLAAVAAELRRAEHRAVLAEYPHLAEGDALGGVSAAMAHAVPLIGSSRSFLGQRRGAGTRRDAAWSSAVTAGLPGQDVRVETWSSRDGHRSRWVLRRSGALPDSELVMWQGRATASASRTCTDLARIGTVADGVVAADWFLSRGYAQGPDLGERERRRETLEHSLSHLEGRPGAARARRMVVLATGLSESPAESLALCCLDLLGVKGIRQQVELVDSDGLVGRADFVLRTRGGRESVLEIDGAQKYLDDADAPGSGAALRGDAAGVRNPLFREKRREDRIRKLGYGAIRLVWSDLMHPERVGKLLREADVL